MVRIGAELTDHLGTILLTLYSIGLIVLAVLRSTGVGAAQRIKRGPAFLVGPAASIVYQGIFFVFNR